MARLCGDSQRLAQALHAGDVAGQARQEPRRDDRPAGSGRPAAPPRPPKPRCPGRALHGVAAAALLRWTGVSGAAPSGPRGFGGAGGTMVRPGTACCRPTAGGCGRPGQHGAASPPRSPRARGRRRWRSRRGAPSPPRTNAQTRLGWSLTWPGGQNRPPEESVWGHTATAPSRPKPPRFCENELCASGAKQQQQHEKKKKKEGGGSKRGVRKWAIKTDRATNEKKKIAGAEGPGLVSFAQSLAGCLKDRGGPMEPAHRAGAARGAPAPPPPAGEDGSALIPLTTSAPRFVLNVHFYWCPPFAKMCLIT